MTHTPHPTKGIALVMTATLFFALADTVTKHLAASYPVSVIVLVRYVVNVVALMALLYPVHGSGLWRTQRTGLVLLRALCLCAASLTMAMALRLMPVGEAVSIAYIAPFVVMLLAMPLLGERISLWGWIGASLGFAGVLLVARPGADLDPWGVALCLTNAGFAAAYNLLSRSLSRSETTHALVFNTATVGVVVFAALSLRDLPTTPPGWGDAGLMLLLGLLMTAGHMLFTAAFREAPASLLAPVTYVQIFWAGGLGWLIFDHMPDGLTQAGMALVMLAGMVVALRSHLSRRV